MGVIVTQQPTSINVTGTDLIYSVSSSLATSPQFRYVTDIYESGSNNFITTLKTYPNLYGTANINVARELNDQEGYNDTWKIIQPEANAEVKDFIMYFGEEYASSISSSREIYTGSIAYNLEVFPGGVQVNQGRNFPSASFDPTSGSALVDSPRLGCLLSNNPSAQASYNYSGYSYFGQSTLPTDIALPIGVQDYGTLSILKNPGWEKSVMNIIVINDVGNGYGISIPIDPLIGGNNATGIINVPAGPANFWTYPLIRAEFESNWSAYRIYITAAAGAGTALQQWYVNPLNPGYLDLGITNPYYQWTDQVASLLPQNPCQDYTRFAWTNQYGMWDYYNVYNPLRRNTNVKRNTYSRPNTRYEDCYAGYDIANRGERQYMTEYTDTFSINTGIIDKFTSQWLTEMFLSNDVFIQNGNQFEPIIITNRSIDWNMNQSRQKLFQYEIEYTNANQRETR